MIHETNFYILFIFYAAIFCPLLRQLPFNKIDVHKAKRPSLGFINLKVRIIV